MNKDLICPYCGAAQETHEPDDISSFLCVEECEKCGKEFYYAVDVIREYESWKEGEI